MVEVLVATPLQRSTVTKPYEFVDGISIRELSPILWDMAIVKNYISEDDRVELDETRYWLCASSEYPYCLPDTGRELFDKLRNAAYAMQVICPSGARHIFLKFQRTELGYDNVGAKHPHRLCQTRVGRLLAAEDHGLEGDFNAVYEGISKAFAEGIVRLQNPILLIEHGLQVGNVPLGALMFTMGLDMLFMAGEKAKFVPRLGGFLGLDSFAFPRVATLETQPTLLVRDVIDDVYDFRNIIAHGQEIPPKFREQTSLFNTGGMLLSSDYYRSELMLDSSLFMLTTGLRRIFVEGLFDDVRDTKKWRAKLRLFENRYEQVRGTHTD